MVGKFQTPDGLLMFWDTGRSVTPVQLAEALALQLSAFSGTRNERREAAREAAKFVNKIAQQVNVYPVGKAALAGDGRILVTEPWFEEKDT